MNSYNWKIGFLCFIYAIILLTILIYVRFPWEIYKKYIECSINNLIPGVACHIGKINYVFPTTIKISHIKLNNNIGYSNSAIIDQLNIRFKIKANKIYSEIYGQINEEDFYGNLSYSINKFNQNIGDLSFESIPVKYLAPILLNRDFSGDMSIKSLENRNRSNGVIWMGSIYISNGEIGLLSPFFSIEKYRFESISMPKIELLKNKVIISSCTVVGKDACFSFGGELLLGNTISKSKINAKGFIEFSKEYIRTHKQESITLQQMRINNNRILLVINGELSRPTIGFDR